MALFFIKTLILYKNIPLRVLGNFFFKRLSTFRILFITQGNTKQGLMIVINDLYFFDVFVSFNETTSTSASYS